MSIYHIKKSNKTYIQALSKYCRDVKIQMVEYSDPRGSQYGNIRELYSRPGDMVTCGNLDSIIADVPTDEFTITTFGDISPKHVLPTYYKAQVTASLPIVTERDRTTADEYYGIFSSALESKNSGYLEIRVPTMTQTQASLLLMKIAPLYNVINAVHLPEIETMLFRIGPVYCYIQYGNKSRFATIEEFIFDLDDGFLTHDKANKAQYDFLLDALNARFKPWKEQGYVGEFALAQHSGFVASAPQPSVPQPSVMTAYADVGTFAPAGGVAQLPDANEDNRFTY